MSEETRGRSFDELASGLASGTLSRGKALRLMGAALVGGVLASIPRAAVAAPRCKQPSTCCTCHLEDRTTFQEVVRKCFPQRTTDATCSDTADATRRREECNALCAKFQQNKYPTLVVGAADSRCTAVGTPNAQSICQKTTDPGVSGTECFTDQTCTT